MAPSPTAEKVSRRIAQMEADLNRLQKESDTLTGRVYDPAVQRPLRQTRTRKPFPESLPRDEKRLLPAAPCCPNCGGSLSYLGEDIAEQLELMRSAFRVIRTVREKHACTQCDAIVQAPAPSRPIEQYPEALLFVNWLYNHSSVLHERAEIIKCAEMLMQEDDFEICESILRQQEKLRERIDETLSEKIVQKCRNMNGEYVWPWILPFSAAGMKHTGIQYQ